MKAAAAKTPVRRARRAPVKDSAAVKAARRKVRTTAAATQKKTTGKAKGAAMTVVKAAMYRQLYAEWARGASWGALATEFKMTERRAQDIVMELRAGDVAVAALQSRQMSLRLAEEQLVMGKQDMADAAELWKVAVKANHSGAMVGALRQRREARLAYVELLIRLGYLSPSWAQEAQFLRDAQKLARAFLDAARAHSVPESVIEQVVGVIERGWAEPAAIEGTATETETATVVESEAA